MRFTPATYANLYLGLAREVAPRELPAVTARFWQLVWKHRHWGWRQRIVSEVVTLWRKESGVTGVELAVAKPLTEAAETKLKRELTKAVGQEVELTVSVKPHLLSGLVVTVGDRRYDASLKGRIDSLYHQLAGTTQ